MKKSPYALFHLQVTCWKNISIKKEPLRGVLEKRCSLLPADVDHFIELLVSKEELKMSGNKFFLPGISIVLKSSSMPQQNLVSLLEINCLSCNNQTRRAGCPSFIITHAISQEWHYRNLESPGVFLKTACSVTNICKACF